MANALRAQLAVCFPQAGENQESTEHYTWPLKVPTSTQSGAKGVCLWADGFIPC